MMFDFLKCCFCIANKEEDDDSNNSNDSNKLCLQFAPQGQFSNYHRALYGEIVVIVLKKNRGIFAVPDVTSLLHSPYVLTHLFVQINLDSHFLVKENFTCSMIEFLSDSKFRALPFRINIRIFFLDIVNLLQFAKSASVFNLNLNLSNVSMHIFNETSCRYKLIDISWAQSIRHSNACLADIADFGETLQQVQTEFVKPYQSRNFDKNVWRVDDHLLLENIKRRMILDKHSTKVTMPFTNILNSQKSAHFNQLPTIEEVSRHAFTWNSGEKINCLLRAVKILESQERDIFAMLLEQKSVQTMKKWTHFIDKDVLDALNEILQKTTKSQVMYEKDGVCSLVKKVRNLLVHAVNDERIVKIVGTTDKEVLEYWSNKFPHLILHVYESIEAFDKYRLEK